MSIVERHHQPIRRAFIVVHEELAYLDNEAVLQMVVKLIFDSDGLSELVPILLVYGALPRLGQPNGAPAPPTLARAAALCKVTSEMTKFFSRRQANDTIYIQNGPGPTAAHLMHIGSRALIYRPKKDRWESFFVLQISNEDDILLLPPSTEPTKLRSAVAKPFINESPELPFSKSGDSSHSRNPILEELYQTRSPSPTSRDSQTPEDLPPSTSNENFVSVHIMYVSTQQSTDNGSFDILATDLWSPGKRNTLTTTLLFLTSSTQ